MFNSRVPADADALPTTGRLIRYTLLAAITAAALLVTVVMPSEYGIDPTGVGDLLGLKEMGEIKVSLAQEISAEEAKAAAGMADKPAAPEPAAVAPPEVQGNAHEVQFTLAPNEAAEIKLQMFKGDTASYVWWSNKGRVNFDVHGDSELLQIKFHGYYKGSDIRREGNLTAAFDGYHGWFWRNRTKEEVVVTLQTKGDYIELKRML